MSLMTASRLLSQMPPRREKAWMKQANVAAAMAMPRTVPSDASVLAARMIHMAKFMQLPAILPRTMNAIPKRHVMGKTVWPR